MVKKEIFEFPVTKRKGNRLAMELRQHGWNARVSKLPLDMIPSFHPQRKYAVWELGRRRK